MYIIYHGMQEVRSVFKHLRIINRIYYGKNSEK